jgi:hypothetical protein
MIYVRRMRSLLAAWSGCALALAVGTGCGGDDGGSAACPVPAQAPLPAEGDLLSPAQLPALDCVEGGLADLPGRWFVRDPDRIFTFSYPRYQGSCELGFRNPAWPPDDPDPADGRTRHVWTDGTRLFVRTWSRFELGGEVVFERTSAQVTCVTADGNLGWAWASVDLERGPSSGTGLGTRFAPLDEPARGLARVGGVAGDGDDAIVGYNVVVDGDHAYVVGTTGLHVIDVVDPAAPRRLISLRGPQDDGFNDVRLVRGGGRAVVFAAPLSADRISVFDVTEPATPRRLVDLPEYAHSLQVARAGERTLLYLATYEDSVPVYDVTDPTQPRRLGAPTIPGPRSGVHDLTVDGDTLYLNYTEEGMVAMDVSGGFDRPGVLLGRIPTTYSHASWVATIGGKKLVIHGDEGMTPDGGAFMRVLDGDRASPGYLRELSRWRTRPEVGIHNMEIHGTKAYVAYYQDGVRVVDLADPAQPREVAHYNTWDPATAAGGAFDGAVGVRLVDGLVYVADLDQGLVILRETP